MKGVLAANMSLGNAGNKELGLNLSKNNVVKALKVGLNASNPAKVVNSTVIKVVNLKVSDNKSQIPLANKTVIYK